MQVRKPAIALVAALAVALPTASPALAAHWHHGGGGGWHGGGWHGGGWHGGGWGSAAAGFAAGALVGGAAAAAASPYYYSDGPYAYDDGYIYGESYAAAPEHGGGRDDQYCAQRYRSYDPSSGTYLGYDGIRHPCP